MGNPVEEWVTLYVSQLYYLSISEIPPNLGSRNTVCNKAPEVHLLKTEVDERGTSARFKATGQNLCLTFCKSETIDLFLDLGLRDWGFI